MALRGVLNPLKRRELLLNAKNCPVWVLSDRTIRTLSCRHPNKEQKSKTEVSLLVLHELPAWKAASRQVSGFLTRILTAAQ